MTDAARAAARRAPRRGFFNRLYTGTGAFDIVGKRKRFYLFFAALVLVCIGSMVLRGFNLGIEFQGGTQVQFPMSGLSAPPSTQQIGRVVADTLGTAPESVQTAGRGASQTVL